MINDTYSDFRNKIAGVPQGSILGSLLFDLSIDDLFFSYLQRPYMIMQTITVTLFQNESEHGTMSEVIKEKTE